MKMSCFIFLFISAELSCPYQRTDNAYPRYLDTIVNNVKNEVACEVACTFHEQFVCRSFAFYASASQCFLSGDDKGKIFDFQYDHIFQIHDQSDTLWLQFPFKL